MAPGMHAMKRIPRIKFPQRHPKPSSGSGSSAQKQPSITAAGGDAGQSFFSKAATSAAAAANVGGKASLQPKRTPVTDREIEAVLLGGCF